jgi:hypothetical protein
LRHQSDWLAFHHHGALQLTTVGSSCLHCSSSAHVHHCIALGLCSSRRKFSSGLIGILWSSGLMICCRWLTLIYTQP